MTVIELITELKKFDNQTEVIMPGGHAGHTTFGITEVVEVEDAVLTDGSRYSVCMVRAV